MWMVDVQSETGGWLAYYPFKTKILAQEAKIKHSKEYPDNIFRIRYQEI